MFALNHLTFLFIFITVVLGFINGEGLNASSEAESLPENQAASLINETRIDETATDNIIVDVNETDNVLGYNASSEAESLLGKQAASLTNETTIDETATNNIIADVNEPNIFLGYNASSEAESLPENHPASLINETRIDETATDNIIIDVNETNIVLGYNASSEAESLPGKQAASLINETTIDETATNNIIVDVNETDNVLGYNASSEAVSLPGKQAASLTNETTIDETATNNIIVDVNETDNVLGYNASSEAESLPENQAASLNNETTIDETATDNIIVDVNETNIVLGYNASSEAESLPGNQAASLINDTTIDETATDNITVDVNETHNVLGYNASSEAESLPGQQGASLINETTIDETATDNIMVDLNEYNLYPELASNETGIKLPPTFKHPSKLYNMDLKPAGSSIKLNCAAKGNPTPNITWYKNDAPIARAYSQPSYVKWSILIHELSRSDNGNYTCLVCNELGCISHTVQLQVQERVYSKPVLTRGAVNQTKLVGETAHFSCEFLSEMHYAIYWQRLIIKEESNTTTSVQSEDPSDEPGNLTIFNVTKEHEGWYICVASNILGNALSKGYLTVLDKRNPSRPAVKEGYPGNKTALVNRTVRLTCPILSVLDYFLYWLKPAKNYIGNAHVGAEPIPEGLVVQSDDDTDKPEVLTLYNVTKEKAGWYFCVAINTLGRDSAKGYLTVLDHNN